MIDATISHYRILEKLGAGGMGVVYKALDTRLDRVVALKFLPDNMEQDAQALERFRREAHAASALNHAGICTIYDVGEEDHRSFIAMEFIDGETLSQHIHRQSLSLEHTLDLGIQIADALDVAHTQGIIHRDIKPSNIFVTKRGQAKVLDFGLAKLLPREFPGSGHDGSSSTHAQEPVSIVGVISGTPAYMSPEQIRGDDLDPRTDIFALGLLLYEMASGNQAFGGKTGGVIIESILTRPPISIRIAHPEIPLRLEEIISKCLQKDRDLRYPSAAAVRSDLLQLKREMDSGNITQTHTAIPVAIAASPAASDVPRISNWKKPAIAAAAILAALIVAGWFYNTRRAHALGQMDTVVLADFTNKTGDAIFDDTLRQGLAAQLQQSPFLSLVSEQRIQQTLRLMGQPSDAKLTAAIIGNLCQRVGSKAYLSGSISALGTSYVIGVNAVNCQTGDSLAQEQVTASGKENVLKSLGEASTKLREKLGESLKTVEKLDTPIEQATTPSLEALQAYSLGRKTMQAGDYTGAVPLLKHSIELDPKFAMAHAMLGTSYHNLGEKTLSAQSTRKAYEQRSRVSEWEKFYIESHYYHFVTGDMEKARQAYELWARIYPREQVPTTNLGIIYQSLGQHEKSLTEFREALHLSPADSLNAGNLVSTLIHLNRLDEASAAASDALSKNLDSADLRLYLYQLAFLKNDSPGMAQQVSWAAGKPGRENVMLYMEADTAAYYGKLASARDFSRQAATSAGQAGEREMEAGCEAAAAIREALYGNATQARQHVIGTLAKSNGRDSQFIAALALALTGDSAGAKALTDDLESRFPEDTVIRFNYLPTLRAQVALNSPGNPAKAIETLAPASAYELGIPGNATFWTNLYPVYIRGEAYLAAHEGPHAAAEFQKIVGSRGVVATEPIGALAHLGLARAYALAGDNAKSRAAYDAFFALWKDADPDIPVLQQAKAEYSKLQ
jgi:serine/threonine protein kinase/tetratricopeptide (TPR) repeat protein